MYIDSMLQVHVQQTLELQVQLGDVGPGQHRLPILDTPLIHSKWVGFNILHVCS